MRLRVRLRVRLRAGVRVRGRVRPSFWATVHVMEPFRPSRPSSEAPSLSMDMAFSYMT